MNTWKGSAVTSQANDGTVPGLWGNKFTLNDNVSFIHVVNGHSGTVAIKIPLDDLQEGMPVVITAGRLSGCSMVYAVDDNYFYAYHFGQQAGDTDWLTSRDGVASFYDTHLKLTNKVVDGLKAGEIMSNNDLVDICSKYKRCVITYYGKNNPASGNTRITKGDENVGIFDYNEQFVEARDPRLGLSYALIVKENGRVIVKVYSEDFLFDMSEAGKFSKISGLEFTLKN